MNTTPTALVDQPPEGSIGALLNLPPQLEQLMFGQNVDMTPRDFLLHTQTSYHERVDHHIQQYRATIYTIGMIAGVMGTEAEREEVRSAIADAISQYGTSLVERNRREHWYSDHGSILDILTTTHGVLNTAIGGAERLVGSGIEAAGEALGSDGMENVGAAIDDFGSRTVDAGVTTIYTDPDGVIADAIADLWNSIVDGAKEWWAWFTNTVATEGLIIALAQAHVDASFLVAEIAIDVGIGLVTAGVGGAAFRAIRVVGRRVIDSGTDVVIKLVREGADTIDVKNLRHMDADLPDEVQDRVPDLEDMQGQPDVETRQTPNSTTPSTTLVPGERGQNRAVYEVDADTGRPTGASATLKEDFGSTARGDNATNVGHIGGDGYDGGHLIAHRFMGDTIDGGIAPQVANLNRGPWQTMENEWADWLTKYRPSSGNRVEIDVNIDVDPPGVDVPDGFDVEYDVYEVDVNGNRTRVGGDEKYFPNQQGVEFERVYFRNDGTIR